MSAEYQIKDGGKSYFFMLPNMVDDSGLSVFAFRLYCRFKRVAGEDGKCYQSTRTLADACKMSTASVSRAKSELLKVGLIRITKAKGQHGGRDYDEIFINDIWEKNLQVSTSNLQVSTSNLQVSPQKLASYPGAIKEYPIKKTTLRRGGGGGEEAEIYKLYENEIGSLTKSISEKINSAMDDYSLEWIATAIEEAAAHNARNWAYIEACLKNWKANGFQSKRKDKDSVRKISKSERQQEIIRNAFLKSEVVDG